MQTSSLTERYARALMDAAGEENRKLEVDADMTHLGQLFRDSSELPGLLRKSAQVTALCSAIADHITKQLQPSPLTKNLVYLLVQRKRLGILDSIVAAYLDENNRRNGIRTAIVTSARELESDETERIMEKLARIAGQAVEIEWNIEPSILGGLTIQLGDRIIDGSLTAQIRRLQQHLTQES